jgi:hypothetical protein
MSGRHISVSRILLFIADVDGSLVNEDKVLMPRAQSAVKVLNAAPASFFHHPRPAAARHRGELKTCVGVVLPLTDARDAHMKNLERTYLRRTAWRGYLARAGLGGNRRPSNISMSSAIVRSRSVVTSTKKWAAVIPWYFGRCRSGWDTAEISLPPGLRSCRRGKVAAPA